MVAAGFWSLFLPVGLWFNLVLSAAAMLCFFVYRRSWGTARLPKGQTLVLAFGLCTLVFILIKASGQITNPDTGGYHLPLVRWTEQYPVIKGLANVHTRLGFNYQYLVLCAVYGFSFLGMPTLHALNGYILLLLIMYLVTSMDWTRRKELSWLDVVKTGILFYVLNMSNAVTSLSPDAPATFVIILALLLQLQKIVEGRFFVWDTTALLQVLLSIVAVLFKLSALPVLLFSLVYLPPVFRSRKMLILLLVTGVVAFTPFLIRNYIMSGYLVYPLYSLDLFSVPWKVPYEKVVYEKEVVKYFALGLPYQSEYDLRTALSSWWSYLGVSNRVYRYIIMVLVGCMGLNLVLVIRIIIGGKMREKLPFLIVFVLLYLSLAYWFMLGPDPRFGNGFIVLFIAVNLAFVLYPLLRGRGRLLLPSVLVLLVLVEAVIVSGRAASRSYYGTDQKGIHLVQQAPYARPDTISLPLQGEVRRYVVSDSSACWDCPLPCAYDADHYRMRGGDIRDGFEPAP